MVILIFLNIILSCHKHTVVATQVTKSVILSPNFNSHEGGYTCYFCHACSDDTAIKKMHHHHKEKKAFVAACLKLKGDIKEAMLKRAQPEKSIKKTLCHGAVVSIHYQGWVVAKLDSSPEPLLVMGTL